MECKGRLQVRGTCLFLLTAIVLLSTFSTHSHVQAKSSPGVAVPRGRGGSAMENPKPPPLPKAAGSEDDDDDDDVSDDEENGTHPVDDGRHSTEEDDEIAELLEDDAQDQHHQLDISSPLSDAEKAAQSKEAIRLVEGLLNIKDAEGSSPGPGHTLGRKPGDTVGTAVKGTSTGGNPAAPEKSGVPPHPVTPKVSPLFDDDSDSDVGDEEKLARPEEGHKVVPEHKDAAPPVCDKLETASGSTPEAVKGVAEPLVASDNPDTLEGMGVPSSTPLPPATLSGTDPLGVAKLDDASATGTTSGPTTLTGPELVTPVDTDSLSPTPQAPPPPSLSTPLSPSPPPSTPLSPSPPPSPPSPLPSPPLLAPPLPSPPLSTPQPSINAESVNFNDGAQGGMSFTQGLSVFIVFLVFGVVAVAGFKYMR